MMMRVVAVLLLGLSFTACGGGGSGDNSNNGNNSTGTNYDVAVVSFTSPATANAGDDISISAEVSNLGEILASPGVTFYLSNDQNLSLVSDTLLGLALPQLIFSPGQTLTAAETVSIPDNLASGTYYILAYAPDMGGDTNAANNLASSAITISGTTCTDDSFEDDDSNGQATSIALNQTHAHNHCVDPDDWHQFTASAGQDYAFYGSALGSKSTLMLELYSAGSDIPLVIGALNGYDSGDARLLWTAPDNGTYYVRAAPFFNLGHAGANTEYTLSMTDQAPDLVATGIYVPSSARINNTATLNLTVKNIGFSASGTFDVGVYLSTDADVTTGDMQIANSTITDLVAGANNYNSNLTVTIPGGIAPGQYYVAAILDHANAVTEFNETNNRSEVRSIAINSENCNIDLFEDDDAQAVGNPLINVNSTQARNFCDDAVDWVRVAFTAGQSYGVQAVSTDITPVVALYRANGTLVAAPGNNQVIWTADVTDTYYIKVETNNQQANPLSSYSLLVSDSLPDLSITNDLYPVTLKAGDWYFGSVYVANSGTLDAQNVNVHLYLSSDSTITTADVLVGHLLIDKIGGNSTHYDFYERIAIPVTTTAGTYYLGAIVDQDGLVGETNVANNVRTYGTITVTAPPCAADGDEDADHVNQTVTMNANANLTRNFCDDKEDWYQLTTSPGVVNNITLTVPDASMQAFITVYDQNGNQVEGVTYTSSADYHRRATWTAQASDYRIMLSAYSTSGVSNFNYTVAHAICTPDSYENDDTSDVAGTISNGQSQLRNFCDDTSDWVMFNAVSGTNYTISTSNLEADVDTVLYLYDAGLALQASNDNQSVNKKNSQIRWTAPATGTYYLRVTSYRPGINTGYTLSIQ